MLRASERQAILNCSRQWAKSTVMVVHRTYAEPETLVLVLSPSERQRGSFFARSRHSCGSSGSRSRDNDVSLMVRNRLRTVGAGEGEGGPRVFEGVAAADRRGVAGGGRFVRRGAAHALAIRTAAVAAEVRSCTLAVSDGDLWLMSTPLGQRGFFTRRG